MKHEQDGYAEHVAEAHAETVNGHAAEAEPVADTSARDTVIATVATVGVVAVGAVIFEAALIPGLALGVVAALAPQYAPKVGSALTPMFRATIRGAYRLGRRSREMVAEVHEHMGDIAAEVTAEDGKKVAEEAVNDVAAHAAPEPIRH